jgi:hypothetical protein
VLRRDSSPYRTGLRKPPHKPAAQNRRRVDPCTRCGPEPEPETEPESESESESESETESEPESEPEPDPEPDPEPESEITAPKRNTPPLVARAYRILLWVSGPLVHAPGFRKPAR